jgi:type IV secretory pathway VirB2 component (pilin)
MFAGKKTYITAVVAVVVAVAEYLTGDASLAETANLVFTAVLAAFVRNGIK